MSDGHSCFVLGRCWVQIPALKPAILIKILCGYVQSLQANDGAVL
jgi:hypothetical protein